MLMMMMMMPLAARSPLREGTVLMPLELERGVRR